MQFGIFSVGDVTPDPTTGRTPTEHERIKAMVAIALKAEEVGLDVFATGEHHNPPFVPSSPTTMLGYIAARTERLVLSTSTTLITTNDPVKIAEDFAMLQHLADGRVDLMMGRGNTGPVYPWFGKDIRQGINLAVENYALLHRLWREDVVDWEGKFRTPLQGFTSTPRPLDGVAPVRLARLHPLAGDRRAGRVLRRRLLPQQHLLARRAHQADGRAVPGPLRPLRARHPRAGRSSASAGRCSCGRTRQDAVREFRPYFDDAPVYGHGPSLEEFTEQTPLTVGSPQQVIEKTLAFRDYAGDYQRQLFLMDHAGLPLKTVLEQLDLLGEEVVPVLRKEFAKDRPGRRAGRADPRVPAGRRRKDVREDAPGTSARRSTGMKLVVVSAGLSVPSSTRLLADRLAAAHRRQADVGRRGPGVELRDLAVEIAHNLHQRFPRRRGWPTRSTRSPAAGRADRRHAGVRGVVQRAVQVVLRRASTKDALAGKPVLIGATGGTARHSLVLEHALRPLFAYLKAVVVPTGVYAASEDWGAEGLTARIERAAGELAALMTGLSLGRPPGAPRRRRSFEDVVPFEQRLAALRPAR